MKPRQQIIRNSLALRKIMQRHLAIIGQEIIDSIMINFRRLPATRKLDAIKNVPTPSRRAYKKELLTAMAMMSAVAIEGAEKEVKRTGTKLAEIVDTLHLGEFEDLPIAVRRRIQIQNALLIDTQIKDLEKNIFFQYTSSEFATSSQVIIIDELLDASEDYIMGSAVIGGAGVTAAKVVNEARSAFFVQPDVFEDIAAFKFVNLSPVALICIDLAGTIFSKNDPNHFKFTPPLHFNCKSFIETVTQKELDKSEQKLSKLTPSTKKIADTVQF